MVGDNLSSYPNIEFLTADSPEGLKRQLDQITLPYRIVSIYSQGVKHVAWLSLTAPIKKVTKQKEEINIVKNAKVTKSRTKKTTRR